MVNVQSWPPQTKPLTALGVRKSFFCEREAGIQQEDQMLVLRVGQEENTKKLFAYPHGLILSAGQQGFVSLSTVATLLRQLVE